MPKRAAIASSAVLGGVVVQRRRQQQRVQHRLVETHPEPRLLGPQKSQVEGGVVGHQHAVRGKRVELRQHDLERRPAAHHRRGDAVKADRGLGDRPAGIDQRVEHLAGQQAPVDDAHRADLDDAVAAGGVEAGGLGIEHDVAQLAERALEHRGRLGRAGQQVEVVELRPGRQPRRRTRRAELRRAGARQRQPQQRMAGARVGLAPELAPMALHDVAQPSAGGERLVEPPLEGAERERRPRPDQIEIDPPVARGGFEIEAGRRRSPGGPRAPAARSGGSADSRRRAARARRRPRSARPARRRRRGGD